MFVGGKGGLKAYPDNNKSRIQFGKINTKAYSLRSQMLDNILEKHIFKSN